jgi:hypothetical protein
VLGIVRRRVGKPETWPKAYFQLNASVAEQMKRLWPDAFEVSKQLEKDPKKVATHIRIGITDAWEALLKGSRKIVCSTTSLRLKRCADGGAMLFPIGYCSG